MLPLGAPVARLAADALFLRRVAVLLGRSLLREPQLRSRLAQLGAIGESARDDAARCD